jgi:hypothetical protein
MVGGYGGQLLENWDFWDITRMLSVSFDVVLIMRKAVIKTQHPPLD